MNSDMIIIWRERKQKWLSLKYYPGIRLQDAVLKREYRGNLLMNIMKNSVRDNQLKFETGLTQVWRVRLCWNLDSNKWHLNFYIIKMF
jgi:hypothetical protein